MRTMKEPGHTQSTAAWLRFLLVAAGGLALDLWSKWWAFKHLVAEVITDPAGKVSVIPSHVVRVIPGWLHFHVTVNQGAVFGKGQGFRWFFVAVSLAAIVFLFYLVRNSRREQWFYQLLLGMLLAGVIGNLYDRVMFGYVRDMIYALPKWGVFPWIFNVADSLLCVGVAGMVILSFAGSRHREPQAAET